MVHVVFMAFSRGGMLGLIVTGAVAFFLIPKRLPHYLILGVCVLIGLQLAGKEVRDRFFTIFTNKQERDASEDGRIQLWTDCLDVMRFHPVLGIGQGERTINLLKNNDLRKLL